MITLITKEELIETLLKYKEIDIVKSLEIRDTLTHNSEIADLSLYNHATVYVINELNQPVTVQVKGNWTPIYEGSVNVGTSFDVAAGAHGSRSISVATNNWFPFIWITLTCSVAPSRGAVHAKVLVKPL